MFVSFMHANFSYNAAELLKWVRERQYVLCNLHGDCARFINSLLINSIVFLSLFVQWCGGLRHITRAPRKFLPVNGYTVVTSQHLRIVLLALLSATWRKKEESIMSCKLHCRSNGIAM